MDAHGSILLAFRANVCLHKARSVRVLRFTCSFLDPCTIASAAHLLLCWLYFYEKAVNNVKVLIQRLR